MNNGTQRGVALVMVLLIVAMATTIAAFMAQQQGFWQRAMENGRDRAQARRGRWATSCAAPPSASP